MAHLPKIDLFKQAADFWDLERLYADLATVNGEELSETAVRRQRYICEAYYSDIHLFLYPPQPPRTRGG